MTIFSPKTLEEAINYYAEHPNAHVLAGGTDFMVEVNFNHRKPETILHLGKIESLKSWEYFASNQMVRIGATLPFAECEKDALSSLCPALAQAARTVGSPQIRTTASLGGNLGTCSPAGDSLPVLSALDAQVEVVSTTGTRIVSIHDFFLGPKKNALVSGEIISAVLLPAQTGPQFYAKVGVRNAMVISIASVCFVIHNQSPRVALGSVGPTVLRAPHAENYLLEQMNSSKIITSAICEEFAAKVAEASQPIDDHRSTAQYRRRAVHVLAHRLAEKSFSDVS